MYRRRDRGGGSRLQPSPLQRVNQIRGFVAFFIGMP